jgi:hypothetical protein
VFFFVLCTLCCHFLWIVFVVFFFVLCTLCCHFLWIFFVVFFFVLCTLCCHLLWIVFVVFVFVLCTLCCQFVWIVLFFPLPVFSNVYSKDWGKPIILKSLRTSKPKDLNRMTKLLLRLVNYTSREIDLSLNKLL